MAEQKKKFKVVGKLKGIAITEGDSDKGHWIRAALTIENNTGNKVTVSTFDDNDRELANSLNGKEVEAIYTKGGADDKFKNLEKEGIKALGTDIVSADQQNSIIEEEIIGEEPTPNTPVKFDEKAKIKSEMGAEWDMNDYWRSKFEWDKINNKKIIRQNSFTQSNKLMENLLKGLELGVFTKEEIRGAGIHLTSLKDFAHKIEEDINR